MKTPIRVLLLTVAASCTLAASAQELALSGFGTVGYALSDQPYSYQKTINNHGTFERDSVFALQLDATLNHDWSATVQLKLAPDHASDSGWRNQVSWAFVSWRPSNDWLLRAGKLHVPGYLNSESMDVGVASDYARLPIELYSMSPIYEFEGASFNKTFEWDNSELVFEGYLGKADWAWRYYFRDGIPSVAPAGAVYIPIKIDATGLALTYHERDNTYRIGLHKAVPSRSDGQLWPASQVLVSPFPGISYYEIAGPVVPAVAKIDYYLFNLAMDMDLGSQVRFAGEYGKRWTHSANTGMNTTSVYASLLKRMGQWTPYVYYAQLKSDEKSLNFYQTLNNSSVPMAVPGAALINASQRYGADYHLGYDQHTWAVGTSYALTSTSKIKAEWAQTQVGVTSSLVDSPPGSGISHQSINVLSVSYSFTF